MPVYSGTLSNCTYGSACSYFLDVELGTKPVPAKPGQFFMIRIPSRQDILLGRPFSLCDQFASDGRTVLRFLVKVVGRFTNAVADLDEGTELALTGPLGNSFTIDPDQSQAVCVAGGMGIAPFLNVAREIRRRNNLMHIDLFYGVSSAPHAIPLADFEALSVQTHLATEDGTAGLKGLVTDVFGQWLRDHPLSNGCRVYTCGGRAMAETVARLALGKGIPCEASMEAIFACGIGVCQGCVIPVYENGSEVYRKVCSDGPVFDGRVLLKP